MSFDKYNLLCTHAEKHINTKKNQMKGELMRHFMLKMNRNTKSVLAINNYLICIIAKYSRMKATVKFIKCDHKKTLIYH